MEAREITNEGTLSWIANADIRNRFINEVNISATYPSSPTENGTYKSNRIGLLKRNTVDQAGFGNVADGYDANGNVKSDGINTIHTTAGTTPAPSRRMTPISLRNMFTTPRESGLPR